MGRDLSISVWGWERVQQEINRFGEVLKAFHPDASPFSDAILDVAAQTRQDTAQIREMLAAQQRNERVEDRALKLLESRRLSHFFFEEPRGFLNLCVIRRCRY